MPDADLLRAAIKASGLSARRFAAEVLEVNERTVRRWLKGEWPLSPATRIACQAIIKRPSLAKRA